MAIGDLVPILLPTLLVVPAAAWVTVRDRGGHVVLDLCDRPLVHLASVAGPAGTSSRPLGPVCGALVEPAAASLGARMRSRPEPVPEEARGTAPAADRVTRRRRPLVAVGRTALP